MIALLISPIYILLNIYIIRCITKWLSAWHDILSKKISEFIICAVYALFALSPLISFFAPPDIRFIHIIAAYWLGVVLYSLLFIAAFHLIGAISKKTAAAERFVTAKHFRIFGAVCAAGIFSLCTYGVINAHTLRVTDYNISINKSAGSLNGINAVLIADLHLGYSSGEKTVTETVEKINARNPDIVFIAGDIFDNDFDALENPDKLAEIMKGIKSKYGVYACYGNHDIDEKILAGFTFGGKSEEKKSDSRMDEWLKSAGITLLRDEYVLIDNSFYVYGRPDYRKPGKNIKERKAPEKITASADMSKPFIVLDHEPHELKELSDAGIDADFCGHTHDGQIFPMNILMKLIWENPCGYLKKGNMHNIVTSGSGVFGPNMRIGTKAEICRIHISFRHEG